MTKEFREILETQYEVQNYKGILLIKNPLTKSWFVFFEDQKIPPFYGKMSEVKKYIDDIEGQNNLSVLKKY